MRGDFTCPETYAAEMVTFCLLSHAGLAAGNVPFSAASACAGTPYEHEPLFQAEFVAHAALIRDIFGNPFRPITLDPSWLTSTVLALATGIYAERANDRMPILADALEDANCTNEDILNHCRGPGPHVRGCFVVDLLLSKE